MIIIEAIGFVVFFIGGIIVLITGLFVLAGGAGFVLWKSLLYGVILIIVSIGMLWFAGEIFDGKVSLDKEP
jgi:hypothetical protein